MTSTLLSLQFLHTCVSVLLVAGLALASTPVKGGVAAVKPVDDDAREAFNAVKNEVAVKFHVDAATLTPEKYSKQTVSGTMFFIRIHITAPMVDHFIFAKVLRDIHGNFTLEEIQDDDSNEELRVF